MVETMPNSEIEKRIAACVAAGKHNEELLPVEIGKPYGQGDDWYALEREFCRHCRCGHVSARPALQHELT